MKVSIGVDIPSEHMMRIVDKKLKALAEDILEVANSNIVKVKAVDTGHLLNSGFVKEGFLEYSVIYPVPYASIVEFGRGSSDKYPPIDAIRKWVRRRLGIKNKKKLESVTWAIATKIKERGIQPRPFLRPAVDEVVRKRRAR